MSLNTYIKNNLNDVNNELVILTGANGGLGLEISRTLLQKGASLLLCVRSYDKGEKTKEKLKKEFPNSNINYLIYQQDNFESIKNLVKEIITKYYYFSTLILNVGVLKAPKNKKTEQGFSYTIGVNFYGVYYLMYLLKNFLEQSKNEKRIIFQGSLASTLSKYKKDDLSMSKSQSFRAYNISKTGVENIFIKLSEENTNDNVKYLLAQPGICATGISRNFPKVLSVISYYGMRIVFHSPRKGALCASYLALNDVSNGDIYVPRGIWHISGYPKKIKVPRGDILNKQIINDVEAVLSEYLA